MREIFFAILIVIKNITCLSQGIDPGDDLGLITEFENSSDFTFLMHNPLLDKYELKEDGAFVKRDDQQNKPIIFVPLRVKTTKLLAGYFEATRAIPAYQRIPNRGRYFVIWRDYSQFSFESKTGTIDYYDANYDFYLSGNVAMTPTGIRSWITYDMPDDIRKKYGFGDPGGTDQTEPDRTHPCDLDKNGDVSFGECYKCMRDACYADPECMTICDFLGPICRGQIRVACAIIALFY